MSDSEAVNNDETLRTQHRKEKKELLAKVQVMKKTATKDKKKKILEDIAKLEANLAKKHQDELNQLKSLTISDHHDEIDVTIEKLPQRVSKAQKRREKKETEEREKRSDVAKQEELNKLGPRHTEVQAFKTILKSRGMCLHPIPSDGDCLYNAIRHQLSILNKNILNIKELRRLTADYIEKNKETLILYMTNPDSNEILTDEEFAAYCTAVRDTPAWGGQIEITALVNVLNVPIEVLQATGPPTITGNDTFKGPNLIITYHRHMYSLGEHYNSTRPMPNDEENSDTEYVH